MENTSLTKKGYLRGWNPSEGRLRMLHDFIWEQYNGPIPVGYHIHHIDENKLNNKIENLQLIDPLTHKRIHSGCELRDDGWWKPCNKCKLMKHINDYYIVTSVKGQWPMSICKTCQIINSVETKRKSKLLVNQSSK